MSRTHRRPFLVNSPDITTLRVEAQSPHGAAREVWAKMAGSLPPLTVLDREAGETTEWWVAPGSDKPSPLHRCDCCNAPIRPTGQRGRPATTCEQCEAAA